MSYDLASQSLGYTPGNKLSLWERRAQYKSWLAPTRTRPEADSPATHRGRTHARR